MEYPVQVAVRVYDGPGVQPDERREKVISPHFIVPCHWTNPNVVPSIAGEEDPLRVDLTPAAPRQCPATQLGSCACRGQQHIPRDARPACRLWTEPSVPADGDAVVDALPRRLRRQCLDVRPFQDGQEVSTNLSS